MDALEQLAARMASKLTPDASPGPEPVQRRWGTVSTVHADGTLSVELADSGVVIPNVKVLRSAGSGTVSERCVVDFVGSDLMVVGFVNPTTSGMHSVNALGHSSYLSGSAPAAGAHFLEQFGTNVLAASGELIPFPVAFPNGLVTVTACFGDSPGVSAFYTAGYSLSGFRFYSGAGVGHRVNWTAKGW
jgi:hypothetical protein